MPRRRENREWFECCSVRECPTPPHPEVSGTLPLCLDHAKTVAREVTERRRRTPTLRATADGSRTMQERREALSTAQAAQAQVYYVRTGDHVKIGFTGNMVQRLSQLRLNRDAVLATEPGGRELERQRHHEFSAERIGRREDFNPSRRLLAHIERVRLEHGEPQLTGYASPDWGSSCSGVGT